MRAKIRFLTISSLIAASALLISGALVPAAFADTGGVSASPSVASPNTTISVISAATLGEATPAGYSDIPVFIAVLTPSGTMYGCISDSSACKLLGFTASSSGTYQCTIPFGGAASTLSVLTTGGVTAAASDCSGSNSGTWTGMSSSLCGGTFPAGVTCTGITGFNDLVAGCSTPPYGVGFGTLSPSTGDTSEVGTYQVVVCWGFVTQSAASVGPVTTFVASTTTFQISPPAGVPEFPLGTFAVLLIALPLLVLARAKFSAPRGPVALA